MTEPSGTGSPRVGRLTGRVALVTGDGRGLGRAMALGLAQEGATVFITASRVVAELQSTVAEAQGGHIVALQADVTKPGDCARVVKTVLAQGGRLDMLVNNAGRGMRYVSESFLTEPTRFWETEPEVWRMVIDTNVNGPFLMSRACVG